MRYDVKNIREAEIKNNYEHHYKVRRNCFKLQFSRTTENHTYNWHENIEAIMVMGGEGYIKCGTDTVAVKKGELFIISSEQMHCVYSDSEISYYCLIIDEGFCEDNGLDVKNCLFERKIRDKETIKKFFDIKKLHKKDDAYSPLEKAKMRMAILAFVIQLYEKHMYKGNKEKIKKKSSEGYVKKAMMYINENYTNALSLEHIAEVIGINKSYLSREFKKYAGHTVHTYINTLRCKKAEQCISEGMTVTEAAMECGFENISYFSRTYKNIMKGKASDIKHK